MYEWIYVVQKLIDWVDYHAIENPSLSEISDQVGYSPWYCSEQFHRVVGMTIKEYMAKRRLCLVALALRDTDIPVIDIAFEYGFSSQQTLTRAFTNAYGCAPAAYRRNPVPIPLTMKKIVITPSNHIEQGDFTMSNLSVPTYRIEYIPDILAFMIPRKLRKDLSGPDMIVIFFAESYKVSPIVTQLLLITQQAGNG